MSVRAIQDNDQVYVIIADCGGGDDGNPHTSLGSALARIAPDETGVEIWRLTFAEYKATGAGPEAQGGQGVRVWNR